MRYIICVVVLSLLCAKIISAGKSEHAIMMQEIAEANRILEASVTPIHYGIKPRVPDPEPDTHTQREHSYGPKPAPIRRAATNAAHGRGSLDRGCLAAFPGGFLQNPKI